MPGTEKSCKADLVLLAMGFTNPVATVLVAFGVNRGWPWQCPGALRDSGRLCRTHQYCGQRCGLPVTSAEGQSLVVSGHPRGRREPRYALVDEFLIRAFDLPR